MANQPWNTDTASGPAVKNEPMKRARSLAHTAMERAAAENDGDSSSYRAAQEQARTRREEIREENITRHLKHNLDLKAEKHIRIHGGFQWDLFRDNETGEDLPFAA